MGEDHQEEAGVVEQPKPKKREALVDVIVLSQEGESALVQWIIPKTNNRIARGYVEAAKIEDSKCEENVLAAAQPYGVPWGKLIDIEHFNITPQRIEDELHRRNMWTVADIERDTTLAMRSLVSIMGPIIGQLHQRGRDYERFELEDQEGG